MLDHNEFGRWRTAAAEARRGAAVQVEAGLHQWACFLAEQSVELGLKGFLHGVGAGAWGHDLVSLGEALAAQVGVDAVFPLKPSLRRLSRHYIPARYPDAHPSGSPGEHYGIEDSMSALADVDEVHEAIASMWRELSDAELKAPDAD